MACEISTPGKDQGLDWPASILSTLENPDLVKLRAGLDVEMRRRGIAMTVGQFAEELAIGYFNATPGRPNLVAAPVGTQNIDALSRRGDRYSIKAVCAGKKTGTVYPDPDNRDKQLFEFLLVVKMERDWTLQAIYEFDWVTFCEVRSWDRRMNAWYVSASVKNFSRASAYLP